NQTERGRGNKEWFSHACFDPACPHNAPAPRGFIKRKHARNRQNSASPPGILRQNDAPGDAPGTEYGAHDATAAVKVGHKEFPHSRRRLPVSFFSSLGDG